jgi:hypothetical protein
MNCNSNAYWELQLGVDECLIALLDAGALFLHSIQVQ